MKSDLYLAATCSSACPWQRHSQSSPISDTLEYHFPTSQNWWLTDTGFQDDDGRDMHGWALDLRLIGIFSCQKSAWKGNKELGNSYLSGGWAGICFMLGSGVGRLLRYDWYFYRYEIEQIKLIFSISQLKTSLAQLFLHWLYHFLHQKLTL